MQWMHFSFTSASQFRSGVHRMFRVHNTGLKLKYLFENALASGRQRWRDAIDARQKGKYHRSLSWPSYPINEWNATGTQNVFSALSLEFKIAANQMKEAKQHSEIERKKNTHTNRASNAAMCLLSISRFQWTNRLFGLHLYRTATIQLQPDHEPSLFAIRLRVPHTKPRIYI